MINNNKKKYFQRLNQFEYTYSCIYLVVHSYAFIVFDQYSFPSLGIGDGVVGNMKNRTHYNNTRF